MFHITLKNGKSFTCDSNTTIFEAAKSNGIILEHSCLSARCRSCAVLIEKGAAIDKLDDLVLSSAEKSNNWTLSCNALPISDLVLDIDDLGQVQIFEKKNVPAKIQSKVKLSDSVIQISLRLPPNSNFRYIPGQYINIIRGQVKRSYSIANAYKENSFLTFLIKKYENGLMSNYWFNESKENDLLRIEGPIGSFFFRESQVQNIIFLATGTGIAPIIAILESLICKSKQLSNRNIWVFVGARCDNDLLCHLKEFEIIPNLKYIPVLSRGSQEWSGERGYVQDIVIKYNIPLANSQVYACGSNDMIESSKKLLIEHGLNNKDFFSDAFLATN